MNRQIVLVVAALLAATAAHADISGGTGAAARPDVFACSGADKAKALVACTRLIQSHQNEPEMMAGALRNRAVIYQAKGDTAAAIADYDGVIKFGLTGT